LHIGQYGLIP